MKRKKPTVKRENRLRVNLVLRFPNVNRGKAYDSTQRKFIVYVDGKPEGICDMSTDNTLATSVRCRSLVTIKKVFGSEGNRADSIMEYRVGENFGKLVSESGHVKKFEINFPDANILDVKDNYDFHSLIEIK